MFSLFVLVAVLWGLTSEMVEDSIVNLIYVRMFGWETFLKAVGIATVVVVPASASFVLSTPTLLHAYLPLVQKGGALALVAIGVGWLAFALAGKESEVAEAREAERKAGGSQRSLVLATQMMAVEEAELVVILIPVVLASHALEATVAAIVGVGVALVVASTLRRRFARLVEGRLRLLKGLSGTALLALGLILFFD